MKWPLFALLILAILTWTPTADARKAASTTSHTAHATNKNAHVENKTRKTSKSASKSPSNTKKNSKKNPPQVASKANERPTSAAVRKTAAQDFRASGDAEVRLIAVYQLIASGQMRQALVAAQELVALYPDFQLAQLVYGDLLNSRVRPVAYVGDVSTATSQAAASKLADLREESLRRLQALRERPATGTIPTNFLALGPRTRHAIAIDASRSRLYLFENQPPQPPRLVADYYISIGKLGVDKSSEGDQRTPLGIYDITGRIDPRTLKDFYGAGALPLNYPNPIDQMRGKTGRGIWLHGTPPGQYARAPQASDGCVVLANSDLHQLIQTVETQITPVVIARQLRWASPQALRAEGQQFEETLRAWRIAKSSGDVRRVLHFYASDFRSNRGDLRDWLPTLTAEVAAAQGKDIELKDLSYLHWNDEIDLMAVTFGEVLSGARTGPIKRQYWVRRRSQWQILYEANIA